MGACREEERATRPERQRPGQRAASLGTWAGRPSRAHARASSSTCLQISAPAVQAGSAYGGRSRKTICGARWHPACAVADGRGRGRRAGASLVQCPAPSPSAFHYIHTLVMGRPKGRLGLAGQLCGTCAQAPARVRVYEQLLSRSATTARPGSVARLPPQCPGSVARLPPQCRTVAAERLRSCL